MKAHIGGDVNILDPVQYEDYKKLTGIACRSRGSLLFELRQSTAATSMMSVEGMK